MAGATLLTRAARDMIETDPTPEPTRLRSVAVDAARGLGVAADGVAADAAREAASEAARKAAAAKLSAAQAASGKAALGAKLAAAKLSPVVLAAATPAAGFLLPVAAAVGAGLLARRALRRLG
jgi:hypothetical protein